MKYCITLLLVTLNISCQVGTKREDAFQVAKSYCDCLNKQLANARDSSVDLNNCEREIFSKSRLLTIYADFENRDKYNKATLDSASRFALLVRYIEDSLCYNENKIDFKKIKKHPQTF
jgi:hypothetical protein